MVDLRLSILIQRSSMRSLLDIVLLVFFGLLLLFFILPLMLHLQLDKFPVFLIDCILFQLSLLL